MLSMWQNLVHHKQFPARLSCCCLYLLFELSDEALPIVATIVVLLCSIPGFRCGFWKRVPHISVNLKHASDGLALAVNTATLLQLAADLMTRNCRRFFKRVNTSSWRFAIFFCVCACRIQCKTEQSRQRSNVLVCIFWTYTYDSGGLLGVHPRLFSHSKLLISWRKSVSHYALICGKNSNTVYTKYVFCCGFAKIMDIETSESSSRPCAQPSMYILVQML